MSRGRRVGAVVGALVLLVGCTAGDDGADDDDAASTTTEAVVETRDCAGLTAEQCLLPWPNDTLTVADDTTETGRRLALPADAMPVNVDGTAVDVTDQDRADGFSPVSTILLAAPDVDLEMSSLPTSDDIGASLSDSAGIAVTDAETGERWPYWAELDAQAGPDETPLLMLRPAIAFTEGHTFTVTVRHLRTAEDEVVVGRGTLEWSFTVASAESLSGRLRSMVAAARDLPEFTVDEAGEGGVVTGTFAVPNVLDGDGSTGQRFVLDDAGLPVRNDEHPTYDVRFTCVVGGDGPRPTAVYGHGLLGTQQEVLGLGSVVSGAGLNACATDWLGMSAEDLPTVGRILADASEFPAVADRLQLGQLAFHLLGRLVDDPDGFASDPAFQLADGSSRLEPDSAVFVGLSQGGILGGAVTAVTDQWTRAVLGVPGMGYNTLLTRSSNWPQFQPTFEGAYPDATDRALVLELIQLLWDRGENSGYAQHLDDAEVLLIEAIGDHQVANVSTEVLARTIGATVAPDDPYAVRSDDAEPLWGLERADGFPTTAPFLSVWDYGTPLPPPDNRAPTEPEFGEDPHGAGSDEVGVLTLALGFLTSGEVTDTCGAAPCLGTQLDDD